MKKTDIDELTIALIALTSLPSRVAELQGQVQKLAEAIERIEGKLTGDPDALLDAKSAAALIQITTTALRQAAYRGTIPCVRIGRRVRFRRAELLKLMSKARR